MGVYVKGMEMPDDCRECPFETYYNNCGITRCRATGKDMAVDWKCIPWEGRAEWCPLVEVSIPHGRLIDADAFQKDLIPKWNCLDDTDFANKAVWKSLIDAPTVIEAEDE